MRLFLDTEWADPEAHHLVSLALIDTSETRQFYCEIDPMPDRPTEFVREHVYPHLQGGLWAKPERSFCLSLRNFLHHQQREAPPLVLATHEADFVLLRHALNGFGQNISGGVPLWTPILVTQGDVLGHLETYFERNPEASKRQHHAMVDAIALRWAFEYVIEGSMG